MSYLAVNDFNDTFTTYDMNQKISRTTVITSARVKLLKHGTISDGTLTLEVFDGAISLGSGSITAAEFEAVGSTYAYGYFNFEFSGPIVINIDNTIANKEIIFRITMAGHTEDSNNYIAMIRDFDDPIVTEHGTRPTSVDPETDGWFNPFAVEIRETK